MKVLRVVLDDGADGNDLGRFGTVVARNGQRAVLRVHREVTSFVAAELLSALPVRDATIEEPPVEEIVATLFGTEGTVQHTPTASGRTEASSQANR